MILEAATYWFILFAGPVGGPTDDMKVELSAGPFEIGACYAVAALGIDHLNRKFPDKDFAAACWLHAVRAREPGMELLNLQELAERALRDEQGDDHDNGRPPAGAPAR